MLHIEHLNLVVNDIQETLTFYQAAFPHWTVRAKGNSAWHGESQDWLHFGDDYQFLTFNDAGIKGKNDLSVHQVGISHFAFVTNNVADIKRRLIEAGFTVKAEGPKHPHRANVYFFDPNGLEVEFVQYFSDLPEQRNSGE